MRQEILGDLNRRAALVTLTGHCAHQDGLKDQIAGSGRIVGNTEITRGSNLNFGAVVLGKRGLR